MYIPNDKIYIISWEVLLRYQLFTKKNTVFYFWRFLYGLWGPMRSFTVTISIKRLARSFATDKKNLFTRICFLPYEKQCSSLCQNFIRITSKIRLDDFISPKHNRQCIVNWCNFLLTWPEINYLSFLDYTLLIQESSKCLIFLSPPNNIK